MKITIVANEIGPIGGMERQLRELVSGLVEAGHDVTVISRSCELDGGVPVRWLRVPGPARPFVLSYPWFVLVASLLVRFRARGMVQATGAIVFGRVDVVAVHLCHRALAAKKVVRASRRSPAYRINALLAAAMSRTMEGLAYRPSRARSFVAVSAGGARELASAFPAIAGSIRTIANGIDADEFRPRPNKLSAAAARAASSDLELPLDGPLAVFVGGDWERKGLELALRAVAAADPWQLAVVGPGDEERQRALAAELDAAERVRFLGVRSDTPEILRAADAFLLPTAYETFSLVTYEAAASGLPLLVTRVSGVEDLLVDGRNGFFIARNVDDITAKLRLLGADEELRIRLGRAARADTAGYTYERMVAAYGALYSALSGGDPQDRLDQTREGPSSVAEPLNRG